MRNRSAKNQGIVDKNVQKLIGGFPDYVQSFNRNPPFAQGQRDIHRKAIQARRRFTSVAAALESDEYLLLVREVLVAWRAEYLSAKLAGEADFIHSLRQASGLIERCEPSRLGDTALDAKRTADLLWEILERLELAPRKAKIMVGTKALHHLLPDLVVPMDLKFTAWFFYWHGPQYYASQELSFKEAFSTFTRIAQACNPQRFVSEPESTGREWCTGIAKVIDNALIGYLRSESPEHP